MKNWIYGLNLHINLGGSVIKKLSLKQEMQVRSLSQEDPLKEEMTTHPSILAWEIPWTEEPVRLHSLRDCERVRYDLATKQQSI